MKKIVYLLFLCFIFVTHFAFGQCANNNSLYLDLTPTGVGNTQTSYCTFFGDYNTVSVCAGATYSISTCGTGTGSGNTALTIYSNAGVLLAFQNSDNCPGNQETMVYTAAFTGVIRILVDRGAGITCNGSNGNCVQMDVTQTAAGAATSAPGCATQVSPANGATGLCSSNVTLSWTAPSSACGNAATSYSISYGTNVGANNVVNNANVGNVLTYTISGLVPSTTYYWKVTSKNTIGAATGCTTFSFTTAASCPPVDCGGGVTVCNSQTIPGNASGFGTQELGSSNKGCLSNGENQSSWYAFSPSSSGDIGFSIVPGGSIDYDWALWGPYAVGSTLATICPPTTTPIRCSYASGGTTNSATGSYNTGMGNNSWETSPQFAPPSTVNTDGTAPDGTLNGWTRGVAGTVGQVYVLMVDNFTANGTPFTLNWNLSGGASLNCSTLGFSLLTFKGFNVNEKNELLWSTSAETNSYEFIIERSGNGKDFYDIGKVSGAINSTSVKDYKYDDEMPLTGINYYRLKQFNIEGVMFSNIISIDYNSIVTAYVSPNPSSVNECSLFLTSNFKNTFTVKITDSFGRAICDKEIELNENAEKIILLNEIAKLNNGIYFTSITDKKGKLILSTKFIIAE